MKEGSPSTRRGGVPRVLLRGAWWSLALMTAIGSSASLAQVTAPIPPLSEDRVYAVGVPDEYGALRDEIARLERESPQTYRVVVLRSAGSGRRAIRDYLDALVERWEEQARRGPATFDRRAGRDRRRPAEPADHRAGRGGIAGAIRVPRPLHRTRAARAHLYPHAKAGNTERGLRVLVGQIDRWIAERDQELKCRREEIAAREARLRTDVQAALESGRGLRDEARRQLDERKAAGLALGRRKLGSGPPRANSTRQASGWPAAERGPRPGSTGPAVAPGCARRDPTPLARQAENDDRLQAASARAGEVLGEVEAMDRRGLPVEPIRARPRRGEEPDRTGRELNLSEPDRSADLIARAERGARDALAHARSLPDLSRQATEKLAALASLERAARAEFERARRPASSTRPWRRDWAAASGRLATARERAGTDPRAAVADLDEAERSLRSIRDRAAGAANRHHYATRTLPALILGFAIVAAATIFGGSGIVAARPSGPSTRIPGVPRAGRRPDGAGSTPCGTAQEARRRPTPTTRPRCRSDPAAVPGDRGGPEPALGPLAPRHGGLGEGAGSPARVRPSARRSSRRPASSSSGGEFRGDHRRGRVCRERRRPAEPGRTEQAREALKRVAEALCRVPPVARGAAGRGPAARRPYRTGVRSRSSPCRPAPSAIATADPIGAGEALANAKALEALAALARTASGGSGASGVPRRSAARSRTWRAGPRNCAAGASGWPRRRPTPTPGSTRPAGSSMRPCRVARGGRPGRRRAGCSTGPDRPSTPPPRGSTGTSRPASRSPASGRRSREARGPARARSAAEAARLVEDLQANFAAGRGRRWRAPRRRPGPCSKRPGSGLAEADRAASDEAQAFVLAAASWPRPRAAPAPSGSWPRWSSGMEPWLPGRAGPRPTSAGSRASSPAVPVLRAKPGGDRPRGRAVAGGGRACRVGSRGAIAGPAARLADLRTRVEALRRGLAVAQEQAEADVEGYRRTAERLDAGPAAGPQVEALLGGEEKDRPPANQRYRAAARALAEFERDARIDPGSWDRRLRRLDEIADGPGPGRGAGRPGHQRWPTPRSPRSPRPPGRSARPAPITSRGSPSTSGPAEAQLEQGPGLPGARRTSRRSSRPTPRSIRPARRSTGPPTRRAGDDERPARAGVRHVRRADHRRRPCRRAPAARRSCPGREPAGSAGRSTRPGSYFGRRDLGPGSPAALDERGRRGACGPAARVEADDRPAPTRLARRRAGGRISPGTSSSAGPRRSRRRCA